MAVGEGVEVRAGEHVAGAVGVDGFNRRRVDMMDPLAVPDQRAFRAARHHQAAAKRFQCFQRGLRAVGVGVAEGLRLIAEQQVDAVAQHFRQAVAEELHHRRIGERQRGAYPVLLRQLAQTDGGGAGAVGAHQIALQIDEFGGGDGVFIQFLLTHRLGDAQKGVHGAFRVRCDHHQAFAGYAFLAGAGHVGVDAGGLQVAHEKVTGVVVGHLAGVVAAAAEVACRHHGVAGGAAAGVLVGFGFAGQRRHQLLLACLIDERHQALAEIQAGQELIGYFHFGIHQGIAEGVNVVFLFHAGSGPVNKRGHYGGAAVPCQTRFACPVTVTPLIKTPITV